MDQVVNGLTLAFDGLLAIALCGVALAVVRSRDSLTAIIFFIVFGLLMALAWVRLRAPDIALAEAALGSGVSGALLINAYARLSSANGPSMQSQLGKPLKKWVGLWFIVGIFMFALSLSSVVIQTMAQSQNLSVEIEQQLIYSGVKNPVTAVLLNFRGYDTLLEMCVLFSALLGSLILSRPQLPRGSQANWIMQIMIVVLIPLTCLFAGYFLWAGADFPGGAFQAGALLAAGGALMFASGLLSPPSVYAFSLRLVMVAGIMGFLILGVYTMARKGIFLMYTESAGSEMFVIELLSMFAIGLTLLVLLFAGRSLADEGSAS